ncbi:MAG: DUF3343 domain-containing protein [Clostridiaceae bacterium]
MENYYIIVFMNTHNAIEGEKVIKGEGHPISIMPTPSHITQSCGISIRFREESLDAIKKLIQEDKIHIKHLYHKSDTGFQEIL